MPRGIWSLLNEQPRLQIELWISTEGCFETRELLADTGAGKASASFEIALHEDDCDYAGVRKPIRSAVLEGAHTGRYPVYLVRVAIPVLGFDDFVAVVAVKDVPIGFDGIGGFRFLNRFGYGNFSAADRFGLEC